MTMQIPEFVIALVERGTSRKFAIVVWVLYLAVSGGIPADREDLVLIVTMAYVFSEAMVDICGRKAPKKPETPK